MMPLNTDKRLQFEVFDDFTDLQTEAANGRWQVVKGTGGTIALANAVAGRVNIPTSALINDYQLLATPEPVFKFQAKKGLWFEALINATEANTNEANFVIGLASITTTGFLLTANGGLPANWDGAVWWKQGATLQWQFSSSKATAVTTNAAPILPPGQTCSYVSGTDYTLGFEFDPNDGVTGYVNPLFNGLPVLNAGGVQYRQTIALPSAALYAIVGVVAGSASAETITPDYVRCVQIR